MFWRRLSSNCAKPAGDRARQAGALAYLHKPFDLDDLIGLIQHGLGSQPTR